MFRVKCLLTEIKIKLEIMKGLGWQWTFGARAAILYQSNINCSTRKHQFIVKEMHRNESTYTNKTVPDLNK